MDNIKIIAEFFLISLGLTYTLYSPVAKSTLTGNGFIKLISNVSIGALAISIIIKLVSGVAINDLSVMLKLVSLISLIIVSVFHQDKKHIIMWLLYGVIVSALSFNVWILAKGNFTHFTFLYGSSLLLGIITYSMTLGHWYLVVPKLSERPLVVAAIITWIVLAIKLTISTKSILSNLNFFEENTMLGSGYAFNWMLLLMRTLFGYVVILGMSFFNWRLVRMRSIQSSTGILYAMTFFIFIGELISSFIFFNYGLLI